MKNPDEWTDQELIVNTLRLVRSLQDVEPSIATTTEIWGGHEITFKATLESVTFGPKTLEQIDSALEAAEHINTPPLLPQEGREHPSRSHK